MPFPCPFPPSPTSSTKAPPPSFTSIPLLNLPTLWRSNSIHRSEMEDGHGKASSDEASSAEPAHDNAGSRRPYYECTFCKRGFSNAQALGGHMNIHRKDRARERQAPAMASVQERAEQDSEGYGYYNQYANNYSAFYPPTYEPFRGYTTYFPASSSSSSLCSGRDDVRMAGSSRTPYETSMLGEELSLGLSTYVDGDVVTGGGRKRQEVEEAELDLELRLGHHQP